MTGARGLRRAGASFPILAPVLALVLAIQAGPALAHKLKLFATVADGRAQGYAFFIGGGRAQGTDWIARTRDGALVARGRTAEDGSWSFPVPEGADGVEISVDAHEGHVASTILDAERLRFGAVPPRLPDAGGPVGRVLADARARSGAAGVPQLTTDGGLQAPADAPQGLSEAELSRLVEAAVQRQVAPLEARIEALGDRLRYADMLASVFLVAGLAGAALHLRGLRR